MSDEDEIVKDFLRQKTRIRLAEEKCVTEYSMILLADKSIRNFKPREKIRQMRVRTPWGIEVRPMRLIPLQMDASLPEELMYVDVITGTVYHPKTKQCNTPQLTLLGEKR
jgi:hypothetical protein